MTMSGCLRAADRGCGSCIDSALGGHERWNANTTPFNAHATCGAHNNLLTSGRRVQRLRPRRLHQRPSRRFDRRRRNEPVRCWATREPPSGGEPSRRRCGWAEPSPGADVGGGSPVPVPRVLMWAGHKPERDPVFLPLAQIPRQGRAAQRHARRRVVRPFHGRVLHHNLATSCTRTLAPSEPRPGQSALTQQPQWSHLPRTWPHLRRDSPTSAPGLAAGTWTRSRMIPSACRATRRFRWSGWLWWHCGRWQTGRSFSSTMSCAGRTLLGTRPCQRRESNGTACAAFKLQEAILRREPLKS